MERRNFLKILGGLAAASVLSGCMRPAEAGLKRRSGTRPITAAEVLDRRAEYAKNAGERVSEAFKQEFEANIIKAYTDAAMPMMNRVLTPPSKKWFTL